MNDWFTARDFDCHSNGVHIHRFSVNHTRVIVSAFDRKTISIPKLIYVTRYMPNIKYFRI